MKLYEALGRALAIECPHAFALLGDGNMFVMSAYSSMPGARLFQGRHENAVVAMADGYARASDSVGLCSVIDGPGITQVATSLAVAVRHRTPLVMFAGDAPTSTPFNIHEYNQEALARAVGAEFLRASAAIRVLDACREAFVKARSQRTVVVLSVPADVLEEDLEWDFEYSPSVTVTPPPQPVVPPDSYIRNVITQLAKSRRPVIIAGRGAVESGSQEAIRSLSERIGALIGTTVRAKGLLQESEYNLGIVGAFSSNVARELLVEADCVVGIGAGLGYFTTEGGYLFPDATRIQIDAAPVGLHTGQYVADTYLRGDAKATIERMLELMPAPADESGRGYRSAEVATRIAAARDGLIAESGAPRGGDGVHPMAAMLAFDKELTPDTYVVVGIGHFWSFPLMAFTRVNPYNYMALDDFGVIGQCFPLAIGIAVARPDARVLCIDGDGGFIMNVQEIETAVRENVNVGVLVINDGAYGAEVHKLESKGLNGSLTHFGRPDFSEISRAFGAKGETVKYIAEVADAASRLIGGTGVRLVDLWTDGDVASPPYKRLYLGAEQ